MGKKLVMAGFLAVLGYAVFIFINRDVRFLREKIKDSQVKTPRVALEDFIVYRYKDKTLNAKISGRLGHFFEPNQIELNGEIKGIRMTPKGTETFGAEAVMGYFEAQDINEMLDGAELELAELTGFVEVGMRDHVLTTDFAEYRAQKGVVSSTRPVRVEGPGRVFTGEDGFVYNLESQSLDIMGHVEGVVKSMEK